MSLSKSFPEIVINFLGDVEGEKIHSTLTLNTGKDTNYSQLSKHIFNVIKSDSENVEDYRYLLKKVNDIHFVSTPVEILARSYREGGNYYTPNCYKYLSN